MPSDSVIAAVIAKYKALTAANFPNITLPPIWLDEAPQEDLIGNQLRPPYTIIKDDGGKPKWTFGTLPGDPGQNAIIAGEFALEVYYVSLADCDTAMNAILWNGALPNLRLGLAFCTLSLNSPLKSMSVVPTSDQRKYAGFLDYLGNRVHFARQEFRTQVALAGQGY